MTKLFPILMASSILAVAATGAAAPSAADTANLVQHDELQLARLAQSWVHEPECGHGVESYYDPAGARKVAARFPLRSITDEAGPGEDYLVQRYLQLHGGR